MKGIKAQIWIETVLYTLIGLGLIGLVLAFITPKINEEKASISIDQSIQSLNIIDQKITEVIEEGPDNRRIIELGVKKGEFYIDSAENKIKFLISDLEKPYSEVGTEISLGRIKILSQQKSGKYEVEVSLDYRDRANIVYNGQETENKLTPSPTPYQLSVENKGNDPTDSSPYVVIDLNVVSS